MLVGAGTVGVEFAGELTSTYPDMKIIMVDKEPYILGTPGYLDSLRETITTQNGRNAVSSWYWEHL